MILCTSVINYLLGTTVSLGLLILNFWLAWQMCLVEPIPIEIFKFVSPFWYKNINRFYKLKIFSLVLLDNYCKLFLIIWYHSRYNTPNTNEQKDGKKSASRTSRMENDSHCLGEISCKTSRQILLFSKGKISPPFLRKSQQISLTNKRI